MHGQRQVQRRPQPSEGERGSSSVELVLLAPALMFAIFLLIQAALYMHARQVALAGAQQGARLARTAPSAISETGAGSQTRAATLSYLRQIGGNVLTDAAITVTRTPGTARVDVTGRAISIVPGITLTVRAHSAGPTETFRRP